MNITGLHLCTLERLYINQYVEFSPKLHTTGIEFLIVLWKVNIWIRSANRYPHRATQSRERSLSKSTRNQRKNFEIYFQEFIYKYQISCSSISISSQLSISSQNAVRMRKKSIVLFCFLKLWDALPDCQE